ncbi:sensor histidine kinase [Anaerophilus nitritogenes]|uniref:sensor histidine kinase n=1 Tax=Anaerophilus nitritogenes TaxID=2498136 RepID=UPI00101C555F|nr:sensor histidine kinase [Anaerophilus nitritogenes]
MLRHLCKLYTELQDEDIQRLKDIEKKLLFIADLLRADVFIDCLTKDPDKAVVVAEAKPTTSESMYDRWVVGEFACRKDEPAALRTLNIGIATRNLKAVTQENKTVIQNTVPIKNDDGKIIGVIITEQNASKMIKTHEQMEILSETTEQLAETLVAFQYYNEHNITQHIHEGIVTFNQRGIVTYVNPGAIEIYKKIGYQDDIRGMHFNNLVLDGTAFRKIIQDRFCETSEVDLANFSFHIRYAVTTQKNIVDGVNMLIKDITEEKKKEKELILKSVAIKEIHHRVKNNLQTIASLLRLQCRRIDNDLVKKAFHESINRILSIALTHELLAQNGVDHVDIKTIICKLKDTTINYGMDPEKDIKIEVEGDHFLVNSDQATSIALVVNELLQNSVEHAFKNRKIGTIQIKMKRGTISSTISVIDNGVGYNVEDIRENSLGQSIVKQIVKDKLSGNINIKSDQKGTKVVFDFKNES